MVNDTLITLGAFALDFFATLANQVGFCCQKLSHFDEEKKKQMMQSDKTIGSAMMCSWKGVCGLILVFVGSLGHFAALPFCDLTLIATNAGSGVIFNIIIATKYLGEKFSAKYDISAVTCVAIGTLIIILLSNKEQQVFTVGTLLELLTAFRSICYFLATIAAMVAVKLLTPRLLSKLRLFEQDCEQWERAHANDPNFKSILPKKTKATDDANAYADRSDRALMDVLYGLPKDSVRQVSPQSLSLKVWVKLPMILYV